MRYNTIPLLRIVSHDTIFQGIIATPWGRCGVEGAAVQRYKERVMQTIPGRFEGNSIELLEDAPVSERCYVLVTFLEPHLGLAVARRRQPHEVIKPPFVGGSSGETYRRFTVGAIMTRDVVTVRPEMSLANAMHLMRARGITSVVIEPDAQGEWGIVTMRDVLRQFVMSQQSSEGVTVGEVATHPLVTAGPEMSLRECGRIMIEKNVRRLVVWQNERPLGIISDTDIFLFVEERGWGREE